MVHHAGLTSVCDNSSMSIPTSAYPVLDFSNSPDLTQAKQDRVLIDYGMVNISGSRESLNDFIEGLAGQVVTFPDGQEAALFSRDGGLKWSTRRTTLGDRSEPSNFLFSGSLRGWEAGCNMLRIRASFAFNPTRYVRYQDTDVPYTPWTNFPPRLIAGEDPWTNNFEHPILDADNFLHGRGRISQRWLPSRWPIHLARYLSSVTELYLSAIREEANAYGLTLDIAGAQWNLKAVETYWEYHSSEPVRTTLRLLRYLRAQGHELRETRVLRDNSEYEELGGSPCYLVTLRSGVRLRIYAKTESRVRFEFDYNKDGLRSVIGPLRFGSVEDAVSSIIATSEYGHSELTRIFAFIATTLEPAVNCVSPQELIKAVYRAANDVSEGREILDHLIRDLGILIGPRNSKRVAITRLRENGVLTFEGLAEGRRTRYYLAPRYRGAASALLRVFFPDDPVVGLSQ